ncbi:unnamed protein product [Staurois parvus]|uniref:Uncharacterized protein n=1 Tax=Staurois parvus TaxID=386267 RepID=A0ABN9B1D0_9NEOB|nr:unnamed protein product [Staurois parvus]
MLVNAANRLFQLPMLSSTFFIMKNACKVISRYSDGQNTEHRMFPPSLSHIVMTIYTSDLSHPLETKDTIC